MLWWYYIFMYSCSKQISICLTFSRKFVCNPQGLYFSISHSFKILSFLYNSQNNFSQLSFIAIRFHFVGSIFIYIERVDFYQMSFKVSTFLGKVNPLLRQCDTIIRLTFFFICLFVSSIDDKRN